MPKMWKSDSHLWSAIEEREENRAFQFDLRTQQFRRKIRKSLSGMSEMWKWGSISLVFRGLW